MAKKENKRGLLSGILNFVGGPDNDFAENPAQYNNDNDYQFVKSVAFNGWSWDGKNTVNEETIFNYSSGKVSFRYHYTNCWNIAYCAL